MVKNNQKSSKILQWALGLELAFSEKTSVKQVGSILGKGVLDNWGKEQFKAPHSKKAQISTGSVSNW